MAYLYPGLRSQILKTVKETLDRYLDLGQGLILVNIFFPEWVSPNDSQGAFSLQKEGASQSKGVQLSGEIGIPPDIHFEFVGCDDSI